MIDLINYELINKINEHTILYFQHGSFVYKTNNEQSDLDIIQIIDDTIDLSEYQNNIYEYTIDFNKFFKIKIPSTTIKLDVQVINNKTFINMIYNHNIIAIESLWMDNNKYSDYNKFIKLYYNYFILDKWKLRQVISTIVNNSYAKCNKKLTVKKDIDVYRAKKSIFHCIRLYIFGIQIAKYGKIIDYSAANNYWNNIKNSEHADWIYYKSEYKPLLNKLHSEFVSLCPKLIIK